ncbi:DUF5819 family protein [Streptomyces sennicomposti]|uniref:DUF5819 family protein n=1 Tax=Streptomyces sennicomposti TaxID=2873384 RepID=UPI001CA7614E|nr:DUF5819 family protein [Streptomyces sennicomposti]MBY8864226.1 DUF5819 family protein [Streptomyces sennicomposti]
MRHQLLARRAVLLVGTALLGAYFFLAAFSQAPLNPEKVRYSGTVEEILSPYLSQDWQLFAPDPLADDRGILAQAFCADGETTAFYDVTTPYIRRTQNDRFFPSRMSRLVSTGLQSLQNTDPVLNRLRRWETEQKKPVLPPLPYEERSRDDTVRLLSRYALTQMPGVCEGRPQKIQVRVYVHELRPWSGRDDPAAKAKEPVHVEDLGWRKVSDLR